MINPTARRVYGRSITSSASFLPGKFFVPSVGPVLPGEPERNEEREGHPNRAGERFENFLPFYLDTCSVFRE